MSIVLLWLLFQLLLFLFLTLGVITVSLFLLLLSLIFFLFLTNLCWLECENKRLELHRLQLDLFASYLLNWLEVVESGRLALSIHFVFALCCIRILPQVVDPSVPLLPIGRCRCEPVSVVAINAWPWAGIVIVNTSAVAALGAHYILLLRLLLAFLVGCAIVMNFTLGIGVWIRLDYVLAR